MAGLSCTVCDHPQRNIIDGILAAGSVSRRTIADQFGLSDSSVQRHKTAHLDQRMVKAVERKAEKADDVFMDSILNGIASAKTGVNFGMSKADEVSPELAYRLAPGFLAQQARYLELLGQATGRLSQAAAGASTINLCVVMPRDLSAAPAQPQLATGEVIDVPALEPASDSSSDPDHNM